MKMDIRIRLVRFLEYSIGKRTALRGYLLNLQLTFTIQPLQFLSTVIRLKYSKKNFLKESVKELERESTGQN